MASNPHFHVIGVDDGGAGIIETAKSARESIAGALPGDLVHTSENGFELEARPSAARRTQLLCTHFPACGGCRVQHMSDAFYAGWKGAKLEAAFRAHGLAVEVPADELLQMPLGTRRRAVLTARSEAGQYRLGFHEYRSHALVDIDDCVILSPSIMAARAGLKEIARLLSGDGECRLTILDVGAGLDVLAEIGRKRQHLAQISAITQLAARARILRLTVDGEPLLIRAKPQLEIAGVAIEPPPGAFVQACSEAEVAMTGIAVGALASARAKRVADLFCGLGAFTFAAARKARVLAIDSDRAMVSALSAASRGSTGLKPIETKVRDLFHDPLSPRELDHFDGVIFDPPRAGAKAQAQALAASKVKSVIAISCNPLTLARDVRLLVDGGYKIVSARAIDQFLFTPHLEAIVVLSK